MADAFVPKHGPRPGVFTCGYSADGVVYCDQPATWHVMWDGDLDNSLACDEHMSLIRRRWVYDDRHPVRADCSMPGALWLYRDQCCRVPPTTASASDEISLPVCQPAT